MVSRDERSLEARGPDLIRAICCEDACEAQSSTCVRGGSFAVVEVCRVSSRGWLRCELGGYGRWNWSGRVGVVACALKLFTFSGGALVVSSWALCAWDGE